MKIVAAVIGMGVGEKHLEAIDGFMGSKVKIICEKNKKKIQILKKKYPNKLVTSKEEDIFLDKQINLVSLASYDDYHYSQILKCFRYNKNVIVEQANFYPKRYDRQFTGGSQSIRQGWNILRTAGATAKRMLVTAAAQHWQVPVNEVTAKAGILYHTATNKEISYA